MIRPSKHLGVTLLVATSLVACSAPDRVSGIVAATPTRPSAALTVPPPSSGVASGVSIDGAPLGKPGLTAWNNWTSLVGKRAAYIMWYADWSTGFQGFAVTNAYARNATPVITWEMKNRRSAIRYADVLAGKWNKYIDAWAAAAAADGRPVMLRFGHEMNGDWYGWSGARNGASAAAAAQFVATWRYVHARFTSAGATNVTWAWCVNHESVPNASWNVPENYYPGDAYVDWTCADGYNWGTSQTVANGGWTSRWQTFDEVFGPVYQRVTTLAPGKPFMIGEFASSELGGSKAAWIADAAARMNAAYPQLRAFIWFNYNKETDWRVESSAASVSAFKSAFVNQPYFVWR
jgi:beta-mannanase